MRQLRINGRVLSVGTKEPPWRLLNMSPEETTVWPPGAVPSLDRVVILRANTAAKTYYTTVDGEKSSVFTTQNETPGLAVLNNPTTAVSNSALLVLLSLDDSKLYVMRLGARARMVYVRLVKQLRQRQLGHNSEVYRIRAVDDDNPISFERRGYVPEALFSRVQKLHDAPVVVAAAGQSGKPWHAPDVQFQISN